MEIVYVYQKSRREFGRPTMHMADRPAELLDEFAPDPSIKDTQYELRNPTHLDIQAIPEMSEHDVNTESFTYTSVGMLHIEGGWPKDIDWAEKDQTARFRKKVEKDEEYIREVKTLADVVEHHIKQNNAIDIYEVRSSSCCCCCCCCCRCCCCCCCCSSSQRHRHLRGTIDR
jgi:dynein intermediate chain 2